MTNEEPNQTHTRIVEVEITETVTRIAHIEVVSDEPISDERLRESDVVDEITEAADSIAPEKDSGSETEIRIIDPEQEHRYRRSLDGEVDLDEI